MISYTANHIGCDIFEDTLIAGIGSETIGYVAFQRGTTLITGMDKPPYFEWDDQLSGGTDIIQSVKLFPNLLVVNTNKNHMGVERFEITLDANPGEIELLSKQLKKIFKGYENMLHINVA